LESLSNGKKGLYNGINTTGSTSNNIRFVFSAQIANVIHNLYFYSAHDAILQWDFVNGITQVIV